ncbi:TPA: hypothetical protein ACPYU1_004819 [Raoultella planticola]
MGAVYLLFKPHPACRFMLFPGRIAAAEGQILSGLRTLPRISAIHIASRFRLGAFLLSGSLLLVAGMADAADSVAPAGPVQVRGVVELLKSDQLNITSREGNQVTA